MLSPVGDDGIRPSRRPSSKTQSVVWVLALLFLAIGLSVETVAGWVDPDLGRTIQFLNAPGVGAVPDDLIDQFMAASSVRLTSKLAGVGCFMIWVLYAPYLVLRRTPRSEELHVEVGRAAILASLPCLLVVHATLHIAAPLVARAGGVDAPLLLVPFPYAVGASVCGLVFLLALFVRMRHPLVRTADPEL